MKLFEAIQKYEKFVSVMRSKGTLTYLKGKIGIINKYLGEIECSDIDNDTLLDFIVLQRERNDNISNKTLNKYILTIKQVLLYSCKIKMDFGVLVETKKVIEKISDEDIDRVFDYYRANQSNTILIRNYLIFRLLLETGLRLSELMNLTLSDIDINNNVILVKITKTKQERYVFFSSETRLLISKYIIASRLDYYLFIDFLTGDRLQTHSINSICKRLRNKLDIKKPINPHKWRHTFATNFTVDNGNIEVLRQILGHSSLKTTQKYIHVNAEDLRKEYLRLYGDL